MSLISQTKTLVWKNLLIQKRNKYKFIFQLLLPILPLLLLVYITSQGWESSYDADYAEHTLYTHQHSQAVSDMAENIRYISGSSPSIALVPSNEYTETFKSYLIRSSVDFNYQFTEDEFITFADEDAMMDYINAPEYHSNTDVKHIVAAVVFDSVAPEVAYHLRLNDTGYWHSPSTNLAVYDRFMKGLSQFSFDEYNDNVIPIQLILDEIILHANGAAALDLGALTAKEVDEKLSIRMMLLPAAAYILDSRVYIVSLLLQMALLVAYMSPLSAVVSALVEEKELKLRAAMMMIGMSTPAFYLSWALVYVGMLLVSAVGSLIILRVFILQHSSVMLLAAYFVLFAFALTAFACCISTMFSKTKTASTAVTLFLVVFYGLGAAVTYLPASFHPLICLSPINALGQVLGLAASLETGGVGFNINTTEYNDFVSPQIVALMLIFDISLFSLLTVYLDQVLPAEDKVTKPWYFPASSLLSLCSSTSSGFETLLEADQADSDLSNDLQVPLEMSSFIEPAAPARAGSIGASTRGLRKEFSTETGTLVALQGLDLNLYRGEIFGLLGHNGSGKTTAIHMLTGLYAPTSGTAHIGNHSILTDFDQIHRNIGVCPQADALFPCLTVLQHMQLYARIKGLDHHNVEPLLSLLDTLELGPHSPDPKVNAESQTLSGGQKRKLSLAMALIGDPEVVFLDEPTSGMDVAAQRAVWSLLTRMKRDRVIVLTTHSLEEAEIADTIGILRHGALQCCGSPLFLKQAYGVGYTLTITKPDTADRVNTTVTEPTSAAARAISTIFTQHFPWVDFVNETPNEVSFRLPLDRCADFAQLLRTLDDSQAGIGFGQYGLSVRALTDVFMHSSRIDEGATQADKAAAAADESDALAQLWSDMPVPSGISLFTSQMHALVVKRLHSTRRDYKSLFMAIYPCLIMLFMLWGIDFGGDMPARAFDAVALYPAGHPVEIVMHPENAFENSFVDTMSQVYPAFTVVPKDASANPDLLDYNLRQHDFIDTIGDYSSEHPRLAAVSLFHLGDVADDSQQFMNATIYTNSSAPDAPAAFLNAFSNTRMRASGQNVRILSSLHPFPTSSGAIFETAMQIVLFFLLVASVSVIPATMITTIVKEKADQATHLQVISGVTPVAYWLSNFVADLMFYLVPWSLLLLIISQSSLIGNQPIGVFAFATMLFFLACAPMAYVASFLFNKPSTASAMIISYQIISCYVFGLATLITALQDSQVADLVSRVGTVLSPSFGMLFYLISGTSIVVNSSLFNVTRAQVGMLYGLDVVLFWALLVLVQFGDTHNLWSTIARYFIQGDSIPRTSPPNEDSDVREERERIQSGACNNPDEFPLVAAGIRRVYKGGLVAVRDLHMSIRKGQVFGFLGANGAGKSTAMSMLTGNLLPSSTSGPALLNGKDIFADPTAARRVIGYCPQFEALCPLLTGREHLYMYARIKGISGTRLESFVSTLLTQLGLTLYADRTAGTYSMGTKRRLSVAIALVGDPSLVLLDEPSTGVDPASKQDMWNVIRKCMQHRSVILTSHSMEEVEALCNTIAIMARGELQCIGSKQHLKHKFGRGYMIVVKAVPGYETFVHGGMLANMPGLEPSEAHGGVLKFHINKGIMTLADIFERIEQIKLILQQAQQERLPTDADRATVVHCGIDTYSVSETELDQIFIELMNRANAPPVHEEPGFVSNPGQLQYPPSVQTDRYQPL